MEKSQLNPESLGCAASSHRETSLYTKQTGLSLIRVSTVREKQNISARFIEKTSSGSSNKKRCQKRHIKTGWKRRNIRGKPCAQSRKPTSFGEFHLNRFTQTRANTVPGGGNTWRWGQTWVTALSKATVQTQQIRGRVWSPASILTVPQTIILFTEKQLLTHKRANHKFSSA